MAQRQRLDKWLWFARVAKTRSRAARLVAEGHVRLNARRIETPAKGIGPGDVLTIALERQVRVLKVVAPGGHRGGFAEASLLFEELPDPGICPLPGPANGLFKKREHSPD
ncbi:MAG: RNA-binding S4 domain-containing protein, partial [Methylocella sp.]